MLALLLALAIGFGAPPTDGAAADCAWQKHAKRIVKKVKRQGQVKRVVRWKRWWSCEALPAQPTAEVLPTPAPPSAPTPTPIPQPDSEEEEPRRVSVKAEDKDPGAFRFGLSRKYVIAGEVTIELNNSVGQDPHNLNLRLQGSEEAPLEIPEAGPGERRLGSFELPAGAYQLWCSLPQHEEWGMSVALEVRPAP